MRKNTGSDSSVGFGRNRITAKLNFSCKTKSIFEAVLSFVIGLFFGVFAGALGVAAHAGPLDYPWIGMLIASGLVLTGSWFALEAASGLGCVGYFCGVALATAVFLLFPFNGDITALQGEIVSRIWLFLAPLLALVNFARIPAKLRRESKRSENIPACGE